MATVEPLMSHFNTKQRRKVIEANYMSLAAKALFRGNVKTCVAIYQYVKPGLWGYTYLIKYAMKAIRGKSK